MAIASTRRALGPLAPLLAFFVAGLILLSASRIGLALLWLPRVSAVPGAWKLLVVGLRMDTITLAIALFVPAAVLLVLPERGGWLWRPALAAYFAVAFGFLLLAELAAAPFLTEYDSRPNRTLIEYVVYPREVLPTVWGTHPLVVSCALVIVPIVLVASWRVARSLIDDGRSWGSVARLLAVPPLAALLFMGARSTLGPRAANISTAAFSADHLVNELALNSVYSIGYAVYSWRTEVDAQRLYGSVPAGEAMTRVRRGMGLPDSAFPSDTSPLLHRQESLRPREDPYNLVILLEESLGAEFVGSLGGTPLTPNLDALATRGLFFTNLFATGTRTVRGIEATLTGFPPRPGDSIVKLGLAQGGFFTLADLLRRRGYATEFLYGGMSNFDNMGGFFLNDGFDRVLDERTFSDASFRGIWGVSDEDLLHRANEVFRSHGSQPFFALLLSTSNHPPYEFPAGRITPSGSPDQDAIRYADWAIGDFFRIAEQEPYFQRTVFLIAADHDRHVHGASLVPVDRFHIPALIVGPGIVPRRYDGLASQIDLAPTLLDLLGVDAEHPMPGRDLLTVSPSSPGRAFMQYDLSNAYRVGDQVVIHQPFSKPRQFTYADGRLTPAPLDPQLARDALAHLAVASTLYRERRYRLD
jgi:phosphoglycerol transferase MdoB-like AlkP superfamily enzyme